MLSLDLFNSQFEKKLHEGAVDNTIEHLLKPLSLRAAEIRTQLRAGKLDPKQIDQLEKEYEDLVQKRLDIILDRQPKTEQQQPQRPPAKGLLKGRDLVTPQQRVAGATPPQTSMLGKAKETLGSFANWLAGKDDTGPTYEDKLKENDPNSAINAAKYVWEQIRRAHDNNVDIATIRWINNSEPVTMSRNQLYHAVQKIKAMSRQNRNAFATQTLADRNNFYLWLGGQKKVAQRPPLKQASDPFQPELPLGKPKMGPVQERDQKKKSNNPDDIKAGDVKVARELQKLRAQYPAARSDVEAVARAEIDSSERSNQQISAIRGANEKQDALLRQLVALDREQGREIDSLDQENNSLEKQLAQVQATNNRLQQAIGQMTGTKKSSRARVDTPVSPVQQPVASAEVDSATVKKVQDLESQIQALQARPRTPDIEQKLKDLQSRINALPAQAAQALNIDRDKSTGQPPRPQAPAGDLDIKPVKAKTTKAKPKTTKAKPKTTKTKTVEPTTNDDDLNVLDIEEPDMFAVQEHGGGIGPRQHWQSLMKNEGWSDKYNPTPYAVYIDGRQWKEFRTDEEARRVADKVRANLKQQGRDQTVTIAPSQAYLKGKNVKEQFDMPGATVPRKSVIQGYTVFFNPTTKTVSVTRGGESEEAAIEQARMGTVNLKNFRQTAERLIDRIESADDQVINENIKDVGAATAVIACLLTGGSLSGCATAPQKTSAQQVLKTGQDIGRTVQTAQRITRAGVEAEVNQEIRNLLRGIGGRPEELNHSNILRIWRRIKGAPPVQPEPPAPEYGPAEPVKRTPQYEAKEIHTREDFVKERDRLLRMISQETNPANRQILKSAIRQLENRAENEGWIVIQQRMIREDTAALAAEDAILKRVFVKHKNLMMEYGTDKITQAAEEVAYNVGDIAHITDDQINEWIKQVEYILGARP
jgi:hypothetical protein